MTKQAVNDFDVTLAAPLIKKYEGVRLTAYRCPAGILTIGYGHTRGVKEGMRITGEQANQFLLDDLNSTKKELASICHVPLTEGMFIALMSFVFNIGATKCSGYTLFKELNAGSYNLAAAQFPRYCYSGGKVLEGLKRRRIEEQKYFYRDGM